MKILRFSSNTSHIISVPAVVVVTLIAFMFFSVVTPNPANSAVIVTGVIILATILYVWFAFFIRIAAIFWPLSIMWQRNLSIAVMMGAMLLILMQSIGELSWRDVLVVILLDVILYAYIGYMSRTKRASA